MGMFRSKDNLLNRSEKKVRETLYCHSKQGVPYGPLLMDYMVTLPTKQHLDSL